VANCIPPVTTELHVRGNLAALASTRKFAIVGARAASGPAMDRAHAIGRHLASRGVTVVSGGALGIDGAAHRGALDAGGCTIVVLGNGVDIAYPKRHAALFDQIVARGGALVSTFPMGMQPRRATFLQRNGLIAQLADAVVVVEADIKSGSLSTARAAHKLGRPVGASLGSPGTSRLLSEGAALVDTGEDAMELLEGRPRYPAPANLDESACAVRDAIAQGARGIDAIVRVTGLPVRAVLRALPQLESSARFL
jgi:DNA processing protein